MNPKKPKKALVSFLNMNDDGSEICVHPVLKAAREPFPWVNIMSVSYAPSSSFVIH
jgi:hypothetical protein